MQICVSSFPLHLNSLLNPQMAAEKLKNSSQKALYVGPPLGFVLVNPTPQCGSRYKWWMVDAAVGGGELGCRRVGFGTVGDKEVLI